MGKLCHDESCLFPLHLCRARVLNSRHLHPGEGPWPPPAVHGRPPANSRGSLLHPPPSALDPSSSYPGPPPAGPIMERESWTLPWGRPWGGTWSCPTRPPSKLTPIAGRRAFAAANSCVLAAHHLIGRQRRACVPRLSRLSVSVSVPQQRQHGRLRCLGSTSETREKAGASGSRGRQKRRGTAHPKLSLGRQAGQFRCKRTRQSRHVQSSRVGVVRLDCQTGLRGHCLLHPQYEAFSIQHPSSSIQRHCHPSPPSPPSRPVHVAVNSQTSRIPQPTSPPIGSLSGLCYRQGSQWLPISSHLQLFSLCIHTCWVAPVVLQTHCSNTHLQALPRAKPTRPLDISIYWGSWLGRYPGEFSLDTTCTFSTWQSQPIRTNCPPLATLYLHSPWPPCASGTSKHGLRERCAAVAPTPGQLASPTLRTYRPVRRPIQSIAYAVCMALSLGIRLRPQQLLCRLYPKVLKPRFLDGASTLFQRQRLTPQPPCDATNLGVASILANSPCDHDACFTAAIGWGSRSRIPEQIAPGTRRAYRHRRLRFGLPFRLGLSAQRARELQAVQPISGHAGGSLFSMYHVI